MRVQAPSPANSVSAGSGGADAQVAKDPDSGAGLQRLSRMARPIAQEEKESDEQRIPTEAPFMRSAGV